MPACLHTPALPQVPLLKPLTAQQRLAVCTAFTPLAVPAGRAVISKGEAADTFYIIEEGSCAVVGDEGQVRAVDGCVAGVMLCGWDWGFWACTALRLPSAFTRTASSLLPPPCQELARLGPTAYFGERALLMGEPRAATVKAVTGEL